MEEDILIIGGNRTNLDYPPGGQLRSIAERYSSTKTYEIEGLQGDIEAQAQELGEYLDSSREDYNILAYCLGASLALKNRENSSVNSVMALDPVSGVKLGDGGEVKVEPVEEDFVYPIYTTENVKSIDKVRVPGSQPYVTIDAGHFFRSGQSHRDLSFTVEKIFEVLDGGEGCGLGEEFFQDSESVGFVEP